MASDVKIVSLKSFGWTIVLILILASFAFITLITNSKSETIQSNIQVLQTGNDNYKRIDTCIFVLYTAENNSRLFAITSKASYLDMYRNQMRTVASLLTDFEKEKQKQSFFTSLLLSRLLVNKQFKNDEFIYLKRLVDSLITSQVTVISQKAVLLPAKSFGVRTTTKIAETDTVAITSKKQNKRLWKRLVEAVSNTEDSNALNYAAKNTIIVQDSLAWEKKTPDLTMPTEKPENLKQARDRLNAAELKLLNINNRIFSNIQVALKILKKEETDNAENLRKSVLVQTSGQLTELDNLSLGNIAVVLILTIVIIWNVIRLYRNEITIQRFSDLTAQSVRRKGEFLAKVSHEIRTPLNSIIGFSQQIDTNNLEDSLRVKIKAIKNSSDVLLMLVNEILDFSKFESGKIKLLNHPFSPLEMFENVIAILSVLAENKGIKLHKEFELKPELLLNGDDFRLKQVIINLLTNAIKFTPKDGEISIRAVFDEAGDQLEGSLSITVKDSGVGIAEKNLSMIFDDFIQIETPDDQSRHLGTGLGLPICKRIVELYKGTIYVESELGKGSVFGVTIPLTISKIGNISFNKKPSVIKTILNNKKVLLVDDIRMNLLLLSSIMEKNAISYDQASNGEVAYELFNSGKYDLVITDIQMPKMDGIRLTKLIRNNDDKDKSGIPVIGYTGSITDENRTIYLSNGMNDFLDKPFTENDLAEVLSRVIF